jgi:hypothetical protein
MQMCSKLDFEEKLRQIQRQFKIEYDFGNFGLKFGLKFREDCGNSELNLRSNLEKLACQPSINPEL